MFLACIIIKVSRSIENVILYYGSIAFRTVKEKCEPEMAVPSLAWFLNQFIPKHPRYKSEFTGRLKVKRMVQSRQLRNTHQDAHYGSAIFR